jgi:6-phosphogluconate dehydrogenase
MNDRPTQQRYEIGMVGLGVMRRNLVPNMAEHGHTAAAMRDMSVFAKEREQTSAIYQRSIRQFNNSRALFAEMTITYAQGLALPAVASDQYAWLPANLIQAQRDYFGAHTYERIDAKGTFHTEWEKE